MASPTATTGGTSTTTAGNAAGASAHEGRRLPEGVGGLLLVGKLRHVAPNTRNGKQLMLDVEAVDTDGRPSIESVSGWMMTNDDTPTFTPLGQLFAGGHLAPLVGQEVCLAVSARAAGKANGGAALYISCEGIWPLESGADVLPGS